MLRAQSACQTNTELRYLHKHRETDGKKTSKAKTYKLHETIYKYIATGDIH